MADNVAQSIKDLQKDLAALDKQLLSNNANWNKLGQTIVDSMKRGGLGIDDLFSQMKSQKDVLKLRAIIDRDALMDDVKKLQTVVDKGFKNVKVGGVEITGQRQIEQALEGYKAQLKLVPKTLAEAYDYAVKIANTLGGKKSTGTALGNARATEMNKVRTTMEEINKQIDRRTQLEKTLSDLQARNGKSATFEGQRMSAKQLNDEIGRINQSIERYKRTLASLGGRGRQALGALGGDGSKTAIKDQMAAMRELYNLTRQYRQMQEKKRTGGIVNEQDFIDTRNRLREILNQMKQIEKEHPGSRKTAAARLETERLRDRWREVNGEIKPAKSSLESMLPTLRRLASAFGVAFSVQGLVNFGRKLVETRGEFEMQQVAMRSILQNKQLADEIWDKTMQAALQSPFTAMQLTKYTKQLAAYRIETEKLFDTTKRLADVSAGLGVDMGRLILAYGQVKAANYLRASEIRQFTEAGVNVLGELRDYFNDVKGMSVDTAKVMDMVQKRLVTFSDVEAIFKRMTDQGGIFYNMQYVQSQTVKGQINKLHDAYDQMLNSIGKGNEGAIKNMVSLLNNIVKNWREWKTVLDTIAWPLMITSVIKFGRGLLTVGSSARIAEEEIKGLELAGTKLRNLIGKTNPWMALAMAVTAATFAIINHVKAVRATQKEIDEQNLRLYETKELMSGYQKTLEENNRAIKEGKLSEDELIKKRKENSGIIAKLKEQYPDIVRGLDLERDGTDKLTESLKNYNDELERRMTLQNMLGTGGGWFSDTVRDNMQQWETDLSDLKGQLLSVQSNARGGMMKMELKGEQDSPLYSELKKISELDLSDVIKASKEYEDILERIFSAPMRDARWDIDPNANYISKGIDIYGFRLLQLEQFPHDIKQVSKESNIAFKNFITSLEHDFESSVSNIKEYSDKISQEYGNDVLRFIANNTDLINQGVLDGNADVVKTIRTVLQSAGVGLTEESRKYYNQLLNERILYLKYQEALNDAEEKSFSKRVQIAMEARKSYVPIDFFATPASSSTADQTVDPDKDKGNKAKESVSAMISLIKEMNSEYSKLSKSAYGFAKSQDKVTDSFRESFEQIFRVRGGKGTYINYDDIDFTNKAGAAKALQAVFDQIENANAWGKFAKNAKDEMMKAISGLEVEADIDVQVRIREDFGRQMEEALGNYELTLDLQKLNLPSDVLSDLFNLDTVDLSDLRRKVVEFYNERLAVEADPTDLIKQVEGYYKKIDDMERKQQRDRIKDYAKYLEYELSERAKIEMEYTRKSAEVAANQAFTSEQKEQIQKRLKEERDKDIAKQEWEDFKSSETYIQMMEDLEHQGTNALIAMRTELERIRENAENLYPRALKEVVNALEKIDEITIKRGMPISNIRNAAAGVRSARVEALESGLSWEQVSSRKAAKQTQADIKAQLLPMEQQFNILQSQLGAEKEIARLEQRRYENGLKLNEVFGETFMTGDNEYLNEKIAENLGYIELTQENINSLIEKRKTAEGKEEEEITSQIATENTYLQQLYAENELLQKQLEYNLAIAKESLKRAATPEERASLQARINELEEELKKLREQDAAVGNLTKKYGILGDSVQDAVQKLAGWSQQAVDVFNSFKTMMTSLGVDTDTDAWDDLSTAFETIGTVASTAASMATKIASGDYIGAALDAVKGIMDIVTQWAGNNDRELERQIQKHQKRIDALKDAYARLEKQIERTWNSVSYMRTYEQQVENIRAQIRSMEAQLAAERDKKHTDDNAVRQYQRDIQDAYDQLEELEQKSIEVFGGIGEEGYRSAAEGFVEAWKSAFLETGDGLQGLQDHFDEFLQEWFAKQATMLIARKYLDNMFDQIDAAVHKNGNGGVEVMWDEIQGIMDTATEQFPAFSAELEEFFRRFGGFGEGSLSGLAAGIQGMTEEQANILEAYWNSVRMYTASIDQNVAMIASALGVGGNSPSTNPQLQQLQLIAASVQATHQLLQSVTKSGHSLGGYGIKVFND